MIIAILIIISIIAIIVAYIVGRVQGIPDWYIDCPSTHYHCPFCGECYNKCYLSCGSITRAEAEVQAKQAYYRGKCDGAIEIMEYFKFKKFKPGSYELKKLLKNLKPLIKLLEELKKEWGLT